MSLREPILLTFDMDIIYTLQFQPLYHHVAEGGRRSYIRRIRFMDDGTVDYGQAGRASSAAAMLSSAPGTTFPNVIQYTGLRKEASSLHY